MNATNDLPKTFIRVLTILALFAASAGHAWADFRTVVLSTDPDPRTGFPYLGFGAPLINNNGEVAFFADLDDPNGMFGIWSEGDGTDNLRNVVLNGDSAPGSGGMSFESTSLLAFNDVGDVAFNGYLDDFTTIGIWTDRDRPGSSLTKVMADGDPAPVSPARNFNEVGSLYNLADNHSYLAFEASLDPAASPNNFPSSGIFSEGLAGSLSKVAQVADFAPGTFNPGAGTEARFDLFRSPAINDSGHVAFSAETDVAGGGGSVGAAGVWTTSPGGTLRDVALQSESAPGTATTFSIFFGSTAVINNDGDVAFTETLTGLIDGGLRDGIWVERDGTVEKVMFESEAAPGTGSSFETLEGEPLLDGDGNVLFAATLLDGRDSLWLGEPGGIPKQIALQGEAAPDTSANYSNFTGTIAVNDSGQIAFTAELDDFSEALFATDPNGTVKKIVASGDPIEVDGSTYEVDFFSFSGFNSMSGLSDTGEVAFEALIFDPNTFDEVDAVLVSDLVAAPEFYEADFDEDGDVDNADLVKWETGYGASSGAAHMNGDADGDMDVDGDDFLIWQRQFGLGVSPLAAAATAVPEPGTAVLFLMATAVVFSTGRHDQRDSHLPVARAESRLWH